MSTVKVVTASVAALALAVMSIPVVNAQNDSDAQGSGADTGSLPISGLSSGSLEEGALSGATGAGSQVDGAGDAAGEGAGSAGGLGSQGSDEGSLSGLVPENDLMCELPGLGGSVAKFYPLLGISGVPNSVIDLVTTALDSFPNLLELVAGEGAGAALLWQTGSLNEGLCTSIFGGQMVMPPETVYVDEDGQPVSTVTGTPAPGAGSSGSAGSASSESSETTGAATSEQDSEQDSEGTDSGGVDSGDTVSGNAPSTTVLSTTVPVP